MSSRALNWWLRHAPWPFWASCCGWWSPWCWIDDAAHRWFPWTYCSHLFERVDQTVEPFICRRHNEVAERYSLKRYPEYHAPEFTKPVVGEGHPTHE